MSDRPWQDSSVLARQAAGRIAGQVRELRQRWPQLLADMNRMAGMRGQPGVLDWPEWCWLPMSAVGSHLDRFGGNVGADVGPASAIGMWRLLGRRIVVPSPDVAAAWVPGPPKADIPDMDLRLPRGQLIDDLAAACYYLVMPLQEDAPDQNQVRGCYAHLEYDTRPGQGAELRLVVDHSDWGLVPVPVLLTQPTLAWSAAQIAGEGAQLPPGMADDVADLQRTLAWWVWPLLGALLDHSTQLTKTDVLAGADVDANVRGAEVWQITRTRPPVLKPPQRLARSRDRDRHPPPPDRARRHI